MILTVFSLVCSDGTQEVFNVVAFYVADLCHKKEVLGRASVTALYGCPHCKKSRRDWEERRRPAATLPTAEMLKHGKEAERKLGPAPKESATYTRFHHSHFGQTVSMGQ